MLGLFRKKSEESAVAVEETSEDFETADDEATEKPRNCAWCGDDPDEYGSHGICDFHASQLIEQAAQRRARRA
jgi:hypothetical protein